MKITPQILSIPPYISTTWGNVSSMHVKEEKGFFRLIVILRDGPQVEIPNLSTEIIEQIFEAHAHSTESGQKDDSSPLSFTLPFKGDGDTIDGIAAEHNPSQSNLPPLPPKVLKKISTIASAFGMDSFSSLPKAKPGCNCVYCQVMKAVRGHEADVEEEITEEDLKFKNWDVQQTAEKLYKVTNPIDQNENYSVFLGEPIGCTCGSKNCEHIRAVLTT